MQTETTTLTRPGISWYTAPGISLKSETKKETLQKCIADAFDFPEIYLKAKGRYILFMYAKHLERYILERLLGNGIITDMPRTKGSRVPTAKVQYCNFAKKFIVFFNARGKYYFNTKDEAEAYRVDMLTNYFPNKTFKYSLYKIGQLTGCDHATVIHSSKTCQNLMDTDREYREKCLKVIEKLNNNLLILPE